MAQTLEQKYQRLVKINEECGNIVEYAVVRSYELQTAMELIEAYRELLRKDNNNANR